VAWSSRGPYIGVRESGRPLRRPQLRSPCYALREASTAGASAHDSTGLCGPYTRPPTRRTAAATAAASTQTSTGT
jgi:hypothetical protein